MIARPCRPKAGRVAEAADPVDPEDLLPAADQATMLADPVGLLLVVGPVARLPVVLADLPLVVPLEPVAVLRQNR
jgi:hypothetical protein